MDAPSFLIASSKLSARKALCVVRDQNQAKLQDIRTVLVPFRTKLVAL
jgi:hypothetical protein